MNENTSNPTEREEMLQDLLVRFFFILKRPGREREYSLYVEIKWDSNEKPTTGWFSYSRIN